MHSHKLLSTLLLKGVLTVQGKSHQGLRLQLVSIHMCLTWANVMSHLSD